MSLDKKNSLSPNDRVQLYNMHHKGVALWKIKLITFCITQLKIRC